MMRFVIGEIASESCFLVPFVIVGGIVIWSHLMFLRRDAPAAMKRWAKENGYRLVRQDYRPVLRGPFFGTTSLNQMVFRITVRDEQGGSKTGWLCIGTYWWPSVDQIEVFWCKASPDRRVTPPKPVLGKPPLWDRDLDS
jgi:hypothetical protein